MQTYQTSTDQKQSIVNQPLPTSNKPNQFAQPGFNYRRASISFVVLRWLVKILLQLIFRVEVVGLQNLPQRGSYILAANHLSWLDPFLMLIAAPARPRIYFVAARENMQCNSLRAFVTGRIGGVISVERNKGTAHLEMEGRVAEMLAGGGVLGIFPEGTVSEVETGTLLPFKKGVGHFAAQNGVPIVPVALSGTKDLWLGRRVRLTIGTPLPITSGTDPAIALALTEGTAARIEAMLTPPQTYSGPKFGRNFLTNLF